ncbi:cytochrome P450 ClCP1 [Zopfia rhizophila CBS 207.26]|uniref:Cytochrome P450 ClCP1 n=1 Tax=Zopfia rhizophila CBS 207.26 TaxID=1314779 RepID=A0A6A6E1Y3_9PEZI|nr:cytochrome P450 ClCP1 [Zopfia rhizophila CBS 207.26]
MFIGGFECKYTISCWVYNIFFHSLKNIPGPLLWKTSRLPFLISMLRGNLPLRVKEHHDRYGAVVRVAPDELSFLDGWKDIYSSKYLDRPRQWRIIPPGVEADDLISATTAIHARFRKAILPGFSLKARDKQEPLVTHYVDLLMEKLQNLGGEGTKEKPSVVNMVEWISYAAFDMTSDLGWGRPLQCLETGRYQPWMTMITQYQAALFAVAFKYYPPLGRLVAFLTPSFALEALNTVMSIARENVQHRLALSTERPDFIGPIIAHNKSSPAKALSLAEMETNSTLFVLGGTEPTTVALTGTLQLLLTNPACMEKICAEVRSAFATEKDITASSTEGLQYLNAVLREGLRMCPPFPDGLRRVISNNGTTIAGVFVPAGMTVSSACWSTFQSASMFHEPQKFAPERWIEGVAVKEGEKLSPYASDRRDAFYPFSLGPRNCPGQHLAWMEMRILLARLLWKFEFGVPEGKHFMEWTQQKIFWHWQQEEVEVEISVRADTHN